MILCDFPDNWTMAWSHVCNFSHDPIMARFYVSATHIKLLNVTWVYHGRFLCDLVNGAQWAGILPILRPLTSHKPFPEQKQESISIPQDFCTKCTCPHYSTSFFHQPLLVFDITHKCARVVYKATLGPLYSILYSKNASSLTYEPSLRAQANINLTQVLPTMTKPHLQV